MTVRGRTHAAMPTEWRPEEWLKEYQLQNCSEAPIDKFKARAAASGWAGTAGPRHSHAADSQRQVRGRYYLTKDNKMKGKKVPPGVHGYNLRVSALIRSEEPIEHIAKRFPLPPKPEGAPPSIVIAFSINNASPKQNVVRCACCPGPPGQRESTPPAARRSSSTTRRRRWTRRRTRATWRLTRA